MIVFESKWIAPDTYGMVVLVGNKLYTAVSSNEENCKKLLEGKIRKGECENP